MTLDLDTFLVSLYTIVDDLYQERYAHTKPRRPGRRPELSDSEVLTLAICAQWFGTSERAFVRYVSEHWQSYFPKLVTQSSINRRCRDLAGVMSRMVEAVAERMGSYTAPYQALDTVAVPLMRRCRGERHRLFGHEASIGRGGSDRDWYYGCKLMLSVTDDGVITGFLLAPASTDDRWVAECLMCWRTDQRRTPLDAQQMPHKRNGRRYVGPTGPIWPRFAAGRISPSPYVADDGFFGAVWQTHWLRDYGSVVLTARSYTGPNSRLLSREHHSRRQIVETVNGRLKDTFNLHFPKARSMWGLLSRVAAKLTALNLGIYLNRYFGRPDLALATLFNH